MPRRTLLMLIALPTVAVGCRFFRPIDPNAPRPSEERPAAPVNQPAAAPTPSAAAPAAAAAPTTAPSGRDTRIRSNLRWNDANVAAMVLALNNTDISYARLVPARAEREDIRKFGERMLTDHTGVNALVTSLLRKLDVTAEDNEASLDMRDESAEKRDLMRELNGRAFDSTYIENEVKYHQKFLAALDEVLISAARNAELKTLLTNVRPAVAGHLAHAEQVRADVLAKK